MPHDHRVIVVGGGITGLAAADCLLRLDGGLHVTLLEGSERLGGFIQTERLPGYVLERGPDVFLTSKPGGVEFCERLGLADRLQGIAPTAHGSRVLRNGRLYRLPDGLSGLVPTRPGPFLRSPLLSWRGKLRAALEIAVPRRRTSAEESIESFVVRRLGREMYDRLVEPLLSGIYAGDGARLSIGATFPQLRSLEVEHGGLVRGMIARRRAGTERPRGGFVSLPGGLFDMVEAAERSLLASGRVTLRCGAKIRSVSLGLGLTGVTLCDGEIINGDAVLLCTPAPAAAALTARLDPGLAAELAAIAFSSTALVTLAFPRSAVPVALDATGYTVPRAEGRPVLATTWVSSKFAGRAPADVALFRVFIGGTGRADLVDGSDDTLQATALAELRDVLRISAEPTLTRIVRWRDAMPQYDIGHVDRVARIERAVAGLDGLELAGNAYHGVGIPDCIRSGEAAAARSVAALDARDRAMMPREAASVR